ncbi:MAG TPA: hypothetical protein VIS74_06170 [Chthoniobacterales bacterium]
MKRTAQVALEAGNSPKKGVPKASGMDVLTAPARSAYAQAFRAGIPRMDAGRDAEICVYPVIRGLKWRRFTH